MSKRNTTLYSYFSKKIKSNDAEKSGSSQSQVEINVHDASVNEIIPEYDIGLFLNKNIQDNLLKYQLLTTPWVPNSTYNFKADVRQGKRPLLHEWFKQYDWVCYSSSLKGAFEWHKFTTLKSKDFISIMQNKTTNNDRLKLKSIVSSIFFLGTHGLPLRGHSDDSVLFNDLLKLRVECGDTILEDYFKNAPKNATYLSHRIQNNFITIFGTVISNIILEQIKKAVCYSVLADKTMDICGTEQMSICIRYTFNENELTTMREDFLGFIALNKLDAESISNTIIESLLNWSLDLNKLIGQGYDGASTMSGHISGVQKRIQDRKFYENYIDIIEALNYFKINGNRDTSVKSLYIFNSITTLQFLVCLRVIAKYSIIIESVTNILQGVDVDLFGVQIHIQKLIEIISADRTNSEQVFKILMKDIKNYSDDVGIDFVVPRISFRQTLRSNHPTKNPIDYYRISIFIPYLDSISSLKCRFDEKNEEAFSIFSLHPKNLKKMSIEEITVHLNRIKTFYGEFVDNIVVEGLIWFNLWSSKEVPDMMDFTDVLKETKLLPAIKMCAIIAISLPATTCSVERSFRRSLDQFLFNRRGICGNVRVDMFLIRGFEWLVNLEWKFEYWLLASSLTV
ncbi:hypothetical protein QTP88_004962 [Uroleucon formosanum]